MRKIYFLLPGTTGKFRGGGLWAELKIFNLVKQLYPTEVVTYRQKEANHLFLADLLSDINLSESIFVVSWGFDVPKLIKQLGSANIVYHAHSAGYRFNLPADIPIIAVSRNTMGYWGQRSPNSLIYYLPNQIGEEFYDLGQTRDIDILVQARKSSTYLLTELVPQLKLHCKVELLDSYVEDLAGLFNRSKIYLYDSAEYWGVKGVSEGFGLPPLEALACGCGVFSSVNSALADYLDPGFNCHKIAGYSLEYDVERILAVVNDFKVQSLPESFWAEYRKENIVKKLEIILTEIDRFFDRKRDLQPNIKGSGFWRKKQLWLKGSIAKIPQKLKNIRYSK